MFKSFFPNPRYFFWSAALWGLAAVLAWFLVARDAGHFIGLPNPPEDQPRVVGVSNFISAPFIWFYIYYAIVVGIFAAFWKTFSPHPWFNWSVVGSALIVFVTYFQVQVSVAINAWNGPFGELIQASVSKSRPTPMSEYLDSFLVFFEIASVAIVVGSLTRFFVNHYNFRWRTAMNDYYLSHWPHLRRIEGASQRIHEDALLNFTGKRVRIYTHVDEPGSEAAERWGAQLASVGAEVDCADFTGLLKADGSPVKDLNDCTSIHPDEAKELEGLFPQ